MRFPANYGPVLGFSLVLAFLLVNGCITYWNTARLNENEHWVAHTFEVVAQLERVLSTIVNTETGQRGYLLTGNERYLEPYNNALLRYDHELARLKQLISDNPRQQRQVDRLATLITRRISVLAEAISARRQQGLEAAISQVNDDRGQQIMDEARQVVAEMDATERTLLIERQAGSRRSYLAAQATGLITVVAGVSMVLLAYVLVGRDLRGKAEAAARLRQANESLERRVAERTSDLVFANQVLQVELTERRRAEEKARTMSIELQRSNSELEQFASVASHDLQEPLRKIQAFGDRLQERSRDQLGDQGQEYLDRIRAAAGRMRTLINDLLTYSRVTTKALPFQKIDLEQVAKEVAGDLEGRLDQSSGALEIGPLPTVEADALQMRQLLQNLIGNGLKFSRPGVAPRVRVTAREIEPSAAGDAGSVELSVEDNGIGFDESYLDRIFKLFQRLHGRSEYEGTGMGLAICRKIAERHRGSITARSVMGQGATFLVTLPLTQPRTPEAESEP